MTMATLTVLSTRKNVTLAQPSMHSGMGALPQQAGTTFRVWAPFASSVCVAGTFNNWSESDRPLASEGNGYWSADAPEAKRGDEYKFVITQGGQKFWRIDSYAKDVTSSVGNGVIVDSAFDWGTNIFQMPARNELVIYEMHVGTFNDRPGGGPGNLRGIIKRLSYLRDLGINAIQIMPPAEFADQWS
jgi:1,4-alpha-glucan branching enzyme